MMKFAPLILGLSILAHAFNEKEAPSAKVIVDKNRLQILTPSLSERKTAKLRLSNGLEAYIISDPGASQSAASLSMEVGSWSDPESHPGTAHFLEHLLFMGSKTYPSENGYEKHVYDNGGVLNAYTAPDKTVYTFSVNHDAFPHTLDLFSHMFIDPLFTPSGINRELHAVDQENDKNIENDNYRLHMVFKATGNQSHPNALFSTGSAETLRGIPRERVIEWHQENYSADRAHLVVYSPLPLSELEALTTSYFSKIPMNRSEKKDLNESLVSSNQKGHLIAIKPVKDLRTLRISWELPQEFARDTENHNDAILAYILESKHPNSLYDQLKTEGLIDDMSAGMTRMSKTSALFSIHFALTPQGVDAYKTIMNRSFSAISQMKQDGLPHYIFEEMQAMARLDYEYQSREAPFSYTENLAQLMSHENLETFPEKCFLPEKPDAKQYQALLNELTPSNGLYFLTASPELTKIAPDHKEKWSGAEYTTIKLPEDLLANWQSEQLEKTVSLPEPNPYIPSKLTLCSRHKGHENTPEPICIASNPSGKAYYWEDNNYKTPDISWVFHFHSPMIDGSARKAVLTDLFTRGVERRSAATQSYAEAARLSTKLYLSDVDMILRVDGKSEKAPKLLEAVLFHMQTGRLSEEEFLLEQTAMKSQLKNWEKAMPALQSFDLMGSVLYTTAPRQKEKLEVLTSLSYNDYLEFSDQLFKTLYTEGLLTGNLTESQAHQIWEMTQKKLHATPYLEEERVEKQVILMPRDEGPFRLREQSASLGNAALLVIQEGIFSYERGASADVLGSAIKEEFFTTLRTKQQTGYITRAQPFEENSLLFQMFLVQSTTHQPDELIARFELFLEPYVKDFEATLPEGRFEEIRSNLITTLKTPPPNLSGMTSQLDLLAFKHKGNFTHKEKKIEALENLDYETVKKDAALFFSRANRKRLAILIEGTAPEDKRFSYEELNEKELKKRGAYLSAP